MPRPPLAPIVALLVALACPAGAMAGTPRVVVSIAPLHSLIAAITGGVTDPHLIVPAGRSPHTFSLAPSDARALARADIVFLAGGATDRFLGQPLETLAGEAQRLRLLDSDGVERLHARRGGAWRHAHADGAEAGHGHADEDDHAAEPAATDPHAWLDPRNAIAFLRAATDRLAELDPAHAERYRANAAAAIERLEAIDRDLRETLAPLRERPYLVFHDAYQYFERRYGLTPAGSVVVDPGRPPGARRLSELRARIETLGIDCLFVEPQFEPRIADSITEGTGVRLAELDPLGAGLEPGPALYPALLERLAASLRDCLGDTSAA